MNMRRVENVIKKFYDVSYRLPEMPPGKKKHKQYLAATHEGARLALLSELPDATDIETKEETKIPWQTISKRKK